MLSVVMPVYNAEKYLAESIESILNQTFKDFEFIIIDDGSTDSSLSIIKKYDNDKRIKLIEHANYGISKSVNEGIGLSRFDLIARMDADDIAHNERLEKQIKYLLNNNDCGVLGTQATVIDMYGNELYKSNIPTESKHLIKKLPYGSPFYHGSVMFRKRLFEKTGGFNEFNRQFNEDTELWMKMKDITEFRNLDEHLYYYRITPTAGSLRSKKIEKKISALIQKRVISEKEQKELYEYKEKTNREKKFLYNLRIGKIYLERTTNKKKSAEHLIRALVINPFNISLIYNFFLLFVPFSLIRKLKKLDYSL